MRPWHERWNPHRDETRSRNESPLHGCTGCDPTDGIGRTGAGQKYALEARKHIATLQQAVSGITIEVRWCPAHEGVEGNKKADEWAKLAADEPDTQGVKGLEWTTYSDQQEERSMPLPRSLANIKREIAKKQWEEARKWAGGWTSKKNERSETRRHGCWKHQVACR